MSDDLTDLIDAGLTALSTDLNALGITIQGDHDGASVRMGAQRFDFKGNAVQDILAWERLADELPRAVERARLREMHEAAGEGYPAVWSVHTSAVTLAWLEWVAGGSGTRRWQANVDAILAAADDDGAVVIAPSSGGLPMTGVLRSRRLLATIPLTRQIDYIDSRSAFLAKELIPQAASVSGPGKNVSAVIEASWLAGKNVSVQAIHVDHVGTLVEVREALLPLSVIPRKAVGSAMVGNPTYAPWAITAIEREAFDAVDAAAHGACRLVHRRIRRP